MSHVGEMFELLTNIMRYPIETDRNISQLPNNRKRSQAWQMGETKKPAYD